MKTPLKISSSEIGEMNIVAISPPVKNELNRLNEGAIFKTKSDRYSIPYDRNIFSTTTTRMILKTSGLKTSRTSTLTEKISSLSLKIK
jgi:hypothetical protein